MLCLQKRRKRDGQYIAVNIVQTPQVQRAYQVIMDRAEGKDNAYICENQQ